MHHSETPFHRSILYVRHVIIPLNVEGIHLKRVLTYKYDKWTSDDFTKLRFHEVLFLRLLKTSYLVCKWVDWLLTKLRMGYSLWRSVGGPSVSTYSITRMEVLQMSDHSLCVRLNTHVVFHYLRSHFHVGPTVTLGLYSLSSQTD